MVFYCSLETVPQMGAKAIYEQAWVHAKAENLLRRHLVRLGQLHEWLTTGHIHLTGSSGGKYMVKAYSDDFTAKVFKKNLRWHFLCAGTYAAPYGPEWIHPYDDAVAKILLLEACEEAFLAVAHDEFPDNGQRQRSMLPRLTGHDAVAIQEKTLWPEKVQPSPPPTLMTGMNQWRHWFRTRPRRPERVGSRRH